VPKTSIPSANFTPRISFGTGCGRRCGANSSERLDKLEDHGEPVLFDRQPFDRTVRCGRCKGASMGSSFVSASVLGGKS